LLEFFRWPSFKGIALRPKHAWWFAIAADRHQVGQRWWHGRPTLAAAVVGGVRGGNLAWLLLQPSPAPSPILAPQSRAVLNLGFLPQPLVAAA